MYQRRGKQALRTLQKLPWCLGGRGRQETGCQLPAHSPSSTAAHLPASAADLLEQYGAREP